MGYWRVYLAARTERLPPDDARVDVELDRSIPDVAPDERGHVPVERGGALRAHLAARERRPGVERLDVILDRLPEWGRLGAHVAEPLEQPAPLDLGLPVVGDVELRPHGVAQDDLDHRVV